MSPVAPPTLPTPSSSEQLWPLWVFLKIIVEFSDLERQNYREQPVTFLVVLNVSPLRFQLSLPPGQWVPNYVLTNRVSRVLRKSRSLSSITASKLVSLQLDVLSLSFRLSSAKNSLSNRELNSLRFCSLQLTFLRSLTVLMRSLLLRIRVLDCWADVFYAKNHSFLPFVPYQYGGGADIDGDRIW